MASVAGLFAELETLSPDDARRPGVRTRIRAELNEHDRDEKREEVHKSISGYISRFIGALEIDGAE